MTSKGTNCQYQGLMPIFKLGLTVDLLNESYSHGKLESRTMSFIPRPPGASGITMMHSSAEPRSTTDAAISECIQVTRSIFQSHYAQLCILQCPPGKL